MTEVISSVQMQKPEGLGNYPNVDEVQAEFNKMRSNKSVDVLPQVLWIADFAKRMAGKKPEAQALLTDANAFLHKLDPGRFPGMQEPQQIDTPESTSWETEMTRQIMKEGEIDTSPGVYMGEASQQFSQDIPAPQKSEVVATNLPSNAALEKDRDLWKAHAESSDLMLKNETARKHKLEEQIQQLSADNEELNKVKEDLVRLQAAYVQLEREKSALEQQAGEDKEKIRRQELAVENWKRLAGDAESELNELKDTQRLIDEFFTKKMGHTPRELMEANGAAAQPAPHEGPVNMDDIFAENAQTGAKPATPNAKPMSEASESDESQGQHRRGFSIKWRPSERRQAGTNTQSGTPQSEAGSASAAAHTVEHKPTPKPAEGSKSTSTHEVGTKPPGTQPKSEAETTAAKPAAAAEAEAGRLRNDMLADQKRIDEIFGSGKTSLFGGASTTPSAETRTIFDSGLKAATKRADLQSILMKRSIPFVANSLSPEDAIRRKEFLSKWDSFT